MHIILYARVSTSEQAERELSLPAQRRLMERYAAEHGFEVVGYFEDVASGKYFKERPGLMAALQCLATNRSVRGLLVHKLDRLSRNTFNYLLLKGQLRRRDVRIFSVVESLEDSPLGEFLEHIMAAQAEFYSANLSLEVKKGLNERLLRGQWAGSAPVGYLMVHGRLLPDPARGHLVRRGFELWATGKYTSRELAGEMRKAGLVGQSGIPLRPTAWCRILHNPIYSGLMVVKGKSYPGGHQTLISRELFARVQEVFRQKQGPGSKHARRHLTFLLTHKARCSRCGSTLVGEEHKKPSGRIYRYYRCHQVSCRHCVPVQFLDDRVTRKLIEVRVPERLILGLKRRLRANAVKNGEQETDRVRRLRAERRRVDEELRQLARHYATGSVSEESYELSRAALLDAQRAAEWLLATRSEVQDPSAQDRRLLKMLHSFETIVRGPDVIAAREIVDALVERIEFEGTGLTLILTEPARKLLDEADGGRISPLQRGGKNARGRAPGESQCESIL